MKRIIIAIALLGTLTTGAYAWLGLGNQQGRLGVAGKGGVVVVTPSCPSPTAPNGVFDLSVCSNASYIIFLLL